MKTFHKKSVTMGYFGLPCWLIFTKSGHTDGGQQITMLCFTIKIAHCSGVDVMITIFCDFP
jgi:hypothetical protein